VPAFALSQRHEEDIGADVAEPTNAFASGRWLFELAITQREQRLIAGVPRVDTKRAEVKGFGRRVSFLAEDLQDLGKLVADGWIRPNGVERGVEICHAMSPTEDVDREHAQETPIAFGELVWLGWGRQQP